MSASLATTWIGPASAVATPLSLLLLGLVALNLAALLRPERLLSRAVGAALLLPLLVLLSLPLPLRSLAGMLRVVIPALVILILAALWMRQPSRSATSLLPARDSRVSYAATALASSLAIALLLALRPHPFEYPGDAGDYLQGFLQAHLQPPPPRSCLVEGLRQPTYQRFCTLWGVILEAGDLNPALLLSGLPQRLTIALEVLVLGLSSFRLLQAARVGAPAAAISWLLVAFGLGNQAIAFLVNHALQGSILAAAIFLEAVMVMLRLLLWRTTPLRQAAALVAALLVFLLLTLKLHGAFALCTLALLVPLQTLLGAARLGGHLPQSPAFAGVSRATARWLLVASLAILALVLSLKTGWLLNKQARFIVPWSFLGVIGLPQHALPGSYLMRTPGSRPEALAVIAILSGGVHLIRSWRPGPGSATCAGPQMSSRQPSRRIAAEEERQEADGYALLASLYALSVLVAFLLPPFSHLFVNLPYEVISNYRLMWGCILFSPLPLLLDHALRRHGSWLARGAAALASLIVLVPLHAGHGGGGQMFWSKTRQLVGPGPARVDLLKVAQALLPSIAAIGNQQPDRPLVVLADEIIGSALDGYRDRVTAIHATRIHSKQNLNNWETHGLLRKARSDQERLAVLREIKQAPALLIQERAIHPYYSPYSEIRVYDDDIALRLSSSGVNQLSPQLLQQAGFTSWGWLDREGNRVPAPSRSTPDASSPAPGLPTYHLWRRVP